MTRRVAWSSTPISATFLALAPADRRPAWPRLWPDRMGQRLALIGVQKHDVAGLGLRLSQFEPQQPPALDSIGILTALQGVPRTAPAKLFLRSSLDSRDSEMVLAPFDLTDEARERPIVAVGNRRFQQRRCHPQRRLRLDWGRPGCRTRLECRDPAVSKLAAPQPHRILANAECLRNATGYSNPPASAGRHAPDPPRPDREKPQAPAMPHAALHSPSAEICQPCPSPANQCEDGSAPGIRWPTN
jgi:hypothetical protein